jgi:hypothetical protein
VFHTIGEVRPNGPHCGLAGAGYAAARPASPNIRWTMFRATLTCCESSAGCSPPATAFRERSILALFYWQPALCRHYGAAWRPVGEEAGADTGLFF